MDITLVIFLFLATHLHAGVITSSTASSTTTDATLPDTSLSADPTTTSSAPFDVDAELAKIAESCFTPRNYEQLTGDAFGPSIGRIHSDMFLVPSVATIGLRELRKALNLAPLPPWKPFNRTNPSESELASAPTIQAYYDLKEPRSEMRSLSHLAYAKEKTIAISTAFLDKRIPSIGTVFRHTFEEIRRSDPGVLDRKVVDRMIEEYEKIHKRVREAVLEMDSGAYGCRDPEDTRIKFDRE